LAGRRVVGCRLWVVGTAYRSIGRRNTGPAGGIKRSFWNTREARGRISRREFPSADRTKRTFSTWLPNVLSFMRRVTSKVQSSLRWKESLGPSGDIVSLPSRFTTSLAWELMMICKRLDVAAMSRLSPSDAAQLPTQVAGTGVTWPNAALAAASRKIAVRRCTFLTIYCSARSPGALEKQTSRKSLRCIPLRSCRDGRCGPLRLVHSKGHRRSRRG